MVLILMENKCVKCHGTWIVKEMDKSVHTCWDCLNSGKMDTQRKDV